MDFTQLIEDCFVEMQLKTTLPTIPCSMWGKRALERLSGLAKGLQTGMWDCKCTFKINIYLASLV